MAQQVKNLTGVREDVGSVRGLIRWVGDLVLLQVAQIQCCWPLKKKGGGKRFTEGLGWKCCKHLVVMIVVHL